MQPVLVEIAEVGGGAAVPESTVFIDPNGAIESDFDAAYEDGVANNGLVNVGGGCF